jgi:hypothetical protein
VDHAHHSLSPAARAGLRAVVAALLAVTLVGCGSSGGGGSQDTGTDSSSSSSSSSDPAAGPEPEPAPEGSDATTAESPGGGDNPAISVARLPVGGASELRQDDPTLQCAEVSWIVDGGEFPQGFAVEPTKVLFTPKVFEVVRGGCGTDQPNCVGFIFRATAQRCDLLVRLVGTIPENTGPSVGFAGLAYCPHKDSDSCRDFVASIGKQKQISVQLTVPPQPEPETT